MRHKIVKKDKKRKLLVKKQKNIFLCSLHLKFFISKDIQTKQNIFIICIFADNLFFIGFRIL